MSKSFGKVLLVLLLTLIALPALGSATVSAESQSGETTINVIVRNDNIDLSLININNQKNFSNTYITTRDSAKVVFEVVGEGYFFILNSKGEEVFRTTKYTLESEILSTTVNLGTTPGNYDFKLVAESFFGNTKEIPFRITVRAVDLPEVPNLPNLPNLPNTGYTKLFGYVVTNEGITSLVFISIIVAAIMIFIFFFLTRNEKEKQSVKNQKNKHYLKSHPKHKGKK